MTNKKNQRTQKSVYFRKNKRGQVGDTITWVIASLIIIAVLIFSVSIASGSDWVKQVIDLDKSVDYVKTVDSIAEKSLYGYLLTVSSGEKIVFDDLEEDQDLDPYTGDLAENIFKELYGKDYPVAVWLGMNFEGKGNNFYFGERPATRAKIVGSQGKTSYLPLDHISSEVYFDNDKSKFIELVLMNE